VKSPPNQKSRPNGPLILVLTKKNNKAWAVEAISRGGNIINGRKPGIREARVSWAARGEKNKLGVSEK